MGRIGVTASPPHLAHIQPGQPGLREQFTRTLDAHLAPAPHRGKRNEPAYLKLIAQKIADLKNITLDEVANATTDNAKKLFKIV